MRNILYFIVITLIASSTAWSLDYGITYLDTPYQSQGIVDSANAIPPLPADLKLVTDSLVDDTVGRVTAHQVGFQLPPYTFQTGGLLCGRQAVVTFPAEFGLTTIDSVTYRDTDTLSPDPQISWVFVHYQSVVIRFSGDIPGPNGPYFVYLTFHAVTNATVADNYRVSVKIDNIYGQTVAGPALSSPFGLTADIPITLTLSPAEDMTLVAGDQAAFETGLLDQYGNATGGGPITLGLDPDLDSIGVLYGNYLSTRTVGRGRVVARYGDLTASSGLITVVPGPAAAISLALAPDTVTAGESLHNDVTATLSDEFGNRVTGYDRSVWFLSDDPSATIVHGQNNPYPFSPSDQGQKVFSGEEFVFQTAGQRTLQVTDGALSAQVDDIFVRSAALADFDVSIPSSVRAGDTFSIAISNARDSYGNPYFGTLTVHCGAAAPDGTLPFLEDIAVSAGAGAGSAMLPRTRLDTLSISGVSLIKLVTVDVLPGAAASFAFFLDSTQFAGVPFRGANGITVADRFGNLKTDFGSSGIVVHLTSDEGDIIPDTIGSAQFTDGIVTLTGYRFGGDPGPATMFARAAVGDDEVSGSASFVANGITIEEYKSYHVPSQIPQDWKFLLAGYGENPGDIAPVMVAYRVGFTEGDSLLTWLPSSSDCLPQPGDTTGCKLVALTVAPARLNPGVHDFSVSTVSLYVIGGDSVEVTHAITQPVEITPFAPPSIISETLPDTVLYGRVDTTANIVFGNTSTFSDEAEITIRPDIVGDAIAKEIGFGQGHFAWSPQVEQMVIISFDRDVPPGRYQYRIQYFLSIQNASAGSLTFRDTLLITSHDLVVLPRATYEVSPQSVTPTRVTVGTQSPFAFDLLLDGITTTVLDGGQCLLTLTDGSVSSSAILAEEAPVLNPGPNRMTTEPMTIPSSWIGKSITGRLHLVGVEAGRAAVDTELVFPFPITVDALPGLQVLSFDLDVPNPPYVNAGQVFAMTGRIVNHSAQRVSGPIDIQVTSDGRSISDIEGIRIVLDSILPGDTAAVTVAVTADSLSNPAEVFTMTIQPSESFTVVPPVDNQAAIVIQSSAVVALTPGSVSIPNAVAYLDYGEPFEVAVRFESAALARVTGGTLALNYTGPGDFGVIFPVEKALDTVVVWNLTAPDMDISSSFTVTWTQAPVDRNTGRPVTGLGGPVTLPFAVRVSITRLVIDVRSLVTAPLQRGVTTPLFGMDVQNVTNDTRNAVRLQSIAMTLTDRNGREIDATTIIADSGSAFYDADGLAVTTLNFSGGRLAFHFADWRINPGQATDLELRLTLKKEAGVDYFNLQMTGDDFAAEIAEGPRAGEAAPVYGLLDKPFAVTLPQAVIAENLGESFKNYPNPFNPDIERTEIRYYLPKASDVDILIFTATGEKVRQMHFAAGATGGQAGVNGGVYWDGRNGEGFAVLNGVYVAVIKVAEGDLTAKVKIAVVK